MKKVFLIIPTIRNLDFLNSWKDEFKQINGIIVEDHPQKEIETPKKYFAQVFHYCWQDIEKELGKDSWIIPRKNSGIRAFGFLKAYQTGADVIITLDDDCYPVTCHPEALAEGSSERIERKQSAMGGPRFFAYAQNDKSSLKSYFIHSHLDNLAQKAPQKWFPTFPHPQYNFTRGFPYQVRNKFEVVISHGLWSGSLDLDAKTEIEFTKPLNMPTYNLPLRQFIPFGLYYPMCSMNLAFKAKITPLMYFPLMGQNQNGSQWGYDRFDDIWAGVLSKKILDHLQLTVVSGSPFVQHKKKSNPKESFVKEKRGLEVNEHFWQMVDKINLKSKTIMGSYKELIDKIKLPQNYYFQSLKKAINIWLDLF